MNGSHLKRRFRIYSSWILWVIVCFGSWPGLVYPDAGHAEIFDLGWMPVQYDQTKASEQASPLKVVLGIPKQGIRPRQPVIASVTVSNLGTSTLRLPMYSHPRNGTIRMVVVKPDGSITEPFDVEGCAADGVAMDLPPGTTYSDGAIMQFDANGSYLFVESGDYYLGAFVEFEPEDGPTVWVTSNILMLRLNKEDDVAEPLLDNYQVRRLMELEGGLHLGIAIEQLHAIEAMGDESEYGPLASYYLGLAYLQAGGNLCSPDTPPEAYSLGLGRLHEALDAFNTGQLFLRKRTAWWLTRCYQNMGDNGAAAEMRGIYEGIDLPFEAREAAMIIP